MDDGTASLSGRYGFFVLRTTVLMMVRRLTSCLSWHWCFCSTHHCFDDGAASDLQALDVALLTLMIFADPMAQVSLMIVEDYAFHDVLVFQNFSCGFWR